MKHSRDDLWRGIEALQSKTQSAAARNDGAVADGLSPALPPPDAPPPAASAPADAADAVVAAAGASTSAASAAPRTSAPERSMSAGGRSNTHAARMRLLQESNIQFVFSRKTGKSLIVWMTGGFPEPTIIGSPECTSRLRALFRTKGQPVKQRELVDINEELCSLADESGTPVELFPRYAPTPAGGLEIDVIDGAGSTVLVDAGGVRVQQCSSTLFLRSPNALALPLPATKGDYGLLRSHVNLEPISFMLYIAWVTYTIAHPKVESTKYVFLVFKGTQGSGKSAASKITQKLIDPRTTGAQTMPRTQRELAILSQAVHLLVFDNLRYFSDAMSDALCIAATGGAVSGRALYTDDGQKDLFLHGPVILNGIHPFMGQSDFADRCLVLNLRPIRHEDRKSEREMLEQFNTEYPVILRGLYDLIAAIMRELSSARITRPARMLDFCRWIAGMELACGLPQGRLQDAYGASLQEMQLETILDNPLAATILEFAEKFCAPEWEGTPTDFYDKLDNLATYSLQRSPGWPGTAAAMSKRLHGLQAPLLAQGVAIDWTRGKARRVTIRRLAESAAANPAIAEDRESDGRDGAEPPLRSPTAGER